MSNSTPFKTPRSLRMPQSRSKHNGFDEQKGSSSDSHESIASIPESTGSESSNGEISLVAEFDDLMRLVKHLKAENVENTNSYLEFVEQTKLLRNEFVLALEECRRLHQALEDKTTDYSDMELKLMKARQLLDKEKQVSRSILKQRNDLAKQLGQVKHLLFEEEHANANVRERFSFLQNTNVSDHNLINNNNNGLSTIKEINSTGSMLSDFSYSRSEDDLDESIVNPSKAWRKHRPSSEGVAEPAIKKRRSSGNKAVEINATDTVRATTTVTVTKEGPIMATSIIESIPKAQIQSSDSKTTVSTDVCASAPPANLVFESWARESPRRPEPSNLRPHNFQPKAVILPDICGPCEKRLRFGKQAMKCKECKALCHPECVDKLPVPCITALLTPISRSGQGVIADYTPTTAPMVPALLIHCINEIELRGLNEIGLYRVPGSEREVKMLKEKFLKGRGAPSLNQVDIHVICGVVKHFLRTLKEPIVTHALWRKFVETVQNNNQKEVLQRLYCLIGELPQPNRDTMAYIILHLKKIAESPDCKMNISNLGKVFGPTIVGYSSDCLDHNELLTETRQLNHVMEQLMNIPSHFWETFVRVDCPSAGSTLQQTPSTDSLLRSTVARNFFTPNRSVIRKQKYFSSPKN